MDPSGHEAGHPQHENAPADLKKNGMSEADAKNQHKNLSDDSSTNYGRKNKKSEKSKGNANRAGYGETAKDYMK